MTGPHTPAATVQGPTGHVANGADDMTEHSVGIPDRASQGCRGVRNGSAA